MEESHTALGLIRKTTKTRQTHTVVLCESTSAQAFICPNMSTFHCTFVFENYSANGISFFPLTHKCLMRCFPTRRHNVAHCTSLCICICIFIFICICVCVWSVLAQVCDAMLANQSAQCTLL